MKKMASCEVEVGGGLLTLNYVLRLVGSSV